MKKVFSFVIVVMLLVIGVLGIYLVNNQAKGKNTYTCGYTLSESDCSVVQYGASQWNGITDNVEFTYVTDGADVTVNKYEGVNPTISGVNDNGNIIIYTTDPITMDNQEVIGTITHEFGHVIGLDHNELIDPSVPSIMTYGQKISAPTDFDKKEVTDAFTGFKFNLKPSDKTPQALTQKDFKYCKVTVEDDLTSANSTAVVDPTNGVTYDSYSTRKVVMSPSSGCDISTDQIYQSAAIVDNKTHLVNDTGLVKGHQYYLELVYSQKLGGYIVSISHFGVVDLTEYNTYNGKADATKNISATDQLNYLRQVLLQDTSKYSRQQFMAINGAKIIDGQNVPELTESYVVDVDSIKTEVKYTYNLETNQEVFSVNGHYYQTTGPCFELIAKGLYISGDYYGIQAEGGLQNTLYIKVLDDLTANNSTFYQTSDGKIGFYAKRQVQIIDNSDNNETVIGTTYLYEAAGVDEFGVHTLKNNYQPLVKGEEYYVTVTDYNQTLGGYMVDYFYDNTVFKLSDYQSFSKEKAGSFLITSFFINGLDYNISAINNLTTLKPTTANFTTTNTYNTKINGIDYQIDYVFDSKNNVEYIKYLGFDYEINGQCFSNINKK